MLSLSLCADVAEHYKRQRITDEALRESRAQRARSGGFEESLANAARCDRLDRVTVPIGGIAQVALL